MNSANESKNPEEYLFYISVQVRVDKKTGVVLSAPEISDDDYPPTGDFFDMELEEWGFVRTEDDEKFQAWVNAVNAVSDKLEESPPEKKVSEESTCPSCGVVVEKRLFRTCPHCGSTKCLHCDMGDDVECPSCLG